MNKNNMQKDISGIIRGDRIFMLYKWKTESDVIVVLQSIWLLNGIVSSKINHLFCYTAIISYTVDADTELFGTYEWSVI
jgi:hypothetical protein